MVSETDAGRPITHHECEEGHRFHYHGAVKSSERASALSMAASGDPAAGRPLRAMRALLSSSRHRGAIVHRAENHAPHCQLIPATCRETPWLAADTWTKTPRQSEPRGPDFSWFSWTRFGESKRNLRDPRCSPGGVSPR